MLQFLMHRLISWPLPSDGRMPDRSLSLSNVLASPQRPRAPAWERSWLPRVNACCPDACEESGPQAPKKGAGSPFREPALVVQVVSVKDGSEHLALHVPLFPPHPDAEASEAQT